MKIAVYVINLDRSVERWMAIGSHAAKCGIQLIRVQGYDGSAVTPNEYVDVDRKSFMQHGARRLLPGEYGCYQSHLACLEMLRESEFDAAIIMEDDVVPQLDLIDRARAILSSSLKPQIVKLFSHRSRGFIGKAVTSYGDEIGQCIHGPQGSAACYVITRSGAERLARKLRRMCFPYDVALERGWAHGVRVFSVRRNIVMLSASCQTQIASRADYRAQKLTGLPRLVTHLDRGVEYARRVVNVLVANDDVDFRP